MGCGCGFYDDGCADCKNNADTIRGNLLCTAQKLDQKGGHSLRSAHRLKPCCVSRSLKKIPTKVEIFEHAFASLGMLRLARVSALLNMQRPVPIHLRT